jgi:hypothetical protein
MRHLLALILTFLALSGSASAMTYRLARFDEGRCAGRCPQAIVAEGTVQVDEPRRLAAFAARVAGETGSVPNTLLLHSPGGNLAGALRLGYGLRRLGLRTVVARVGRGADDRAGDGAARLGTGVCASACVLVLMGGQERLVPSGSRVAVHAARRAGGLTRDILGSGTIDPQLDDGSVLSLLHRYARDMGVDPALMSLAQSVPHESARILSPAEISRFGLASVGPRPARRSR